MTARGRTLIGDLGAVARGVTQSHEGRRWPSSVWAEDPVGFATFILGVGLWSFQIEFLEAIRDYRHVAVAGGRKIGKDFAVAVAALWWFASFPLARVFMLAPTDRQLNGILHRELKMLFFGAGRCVDCKARDPEGPKPCEHSAILTGDVGMLARTGIKSKDFREITGATAVSEGGLRGMSGARILAIEDEASDIKDEFDNALVGNLAGADCHRVLISNPTRTTGFFHRAFHEERHLYRTMQVSTELNPNIVERREVFRGLADRQWLEERELAWGRGSANWSANVEGKFVKAEAGQLFSIEAVTAAERAWEEASAEGRLTIGVDVAGEGTEGDESAFAARRGKKVLELFALRGLSPDAILEHTRRLIAKHRDPSDHGDATPLVVLDRDGPIGARCYDVVNAYRLRDARTEWEFELIGFRGSAPPIGRMSEIYRLNRDALFGGLVDFFREGGAIVSDVKLEAELVALRWQDVERGRSQLIHKSELKDRLGRSPDRLDALALSTWGERRPAPTYAAPLESAPAADIYREHDTSSRTFDPYQGFSFAPRRGGHA